MTKGIVVKFLFEDGAGLFSLTLKNFESMDNHMLKAIALTHSIFGPHGESRNKKRLSVSLD